MKLYQRIPAASIEAVQFTPELAEAVRTGERPDGLPESLEYSEHGGFSFDETRVSFGDYIVGGSTLMAKATFEEQYEPVRAAPVPALAKAAEHKRTAPASDK
jgi:hypothetical protein